ncbi:MAG TPA: adenylosuccinate lyase, partial [Candidatus Eremiobacteraceae bacterium]|nr:adenylosuccinate lyase [Candidatus Eremiobacteraceae bacterium]
MSDSYQSPFSWRYGRPAMRALFSEQTKRRMWRRLWLALAQSQAAAGLVSEAEVADLRRHVDEVDIEAAHAIERDIGHDLMAELRVFASQAKIGGGKLHLGATSMDVEDNVEIARMKVALSMLVSSIADILQAFAEQIERYAARPCMAYTHLQAAEPTTLGLRFALWAQDMLLDFEELGRIARWLPSKGLRGAVGTSASYAALLQGTSKSPAALERDVLDAFDLTALAVSGQTYTRKLDYAVLTALAGFAASCAKFAFDVRILASSPFGELGEPFGAKQVGSSAMPFKRNPVLCERIDSLARLPAANAQVAWENAAVNLLERTLDDSANRRSIIPETFLAVDEIATLVHKVVTGLRVDEARIDQNLRRFGPFAAIEAVLMAAAKRGADRQLLHERLRDASMRAWAALEKGDANPLLDLLSQDSELARYLSKEEIASLMQAERHIGTAAEQAKAFAG